MVPLSFALRAALLTLSTIALPTLSLPAPIAQRDVALHRSSLDSTWDDTDSWEPHAGWFSYNEDEDDDDDEGNEWWEVNSWEEEEEDDDDSYDYSCEYDDEDYDCEEYPDYDEDWDEDENDEGCEWDENDESDWESDDDNDDDPTWEDYSLTNLVIQCVPPCSPPPPPPYPSMFDIIVSPSSPHQTLHSGIGTVYTQDGRVGSCGTSHDDSAFVVALGNDWMHHRYQASECGRQIQVTNKGSRHHVGGEGNTITVTVQDTCASCDAGHVDFSHAAWDALTDGSPPGQVDLEW